MNDPKSVQDRVEKPEALAGGTVSGHHIASFWKNWLSDHEQVAPIWGTPISRADYLESVWRNDSRLSGVLYTMQSRISSLGWSVVGPARGLQRWYDIFSWADEDGWTDFVKMIYLDYLTCDEGMVMETARESYPRGRLQGLWHMDARRVIPGPVRLGDTTHDLIFQDQTNWKTLQKGQFYRTCSLPSTDQNNRRLGFCFMSRILRYALLGDEMLNYQEERVSDSPPEGIVTVTGLTRAQVETAFEEYEAARQERGSLTFPGILWFVANTFGQEAAVNWTSFRDVWQSFSEREWLEVFMKVVSLDAGVDVGEFWQVEFHGATKASSWLQHTKARGKGPAEFIVAFERWATRTLPYGVRFFFDTPDDEQDLVTEQIKAARIKNAKELWAPDEEGNRILDLAQVQELLAEQGVIPSRMIQPKELVLTDVMKAQGEVPGILRWPDGIIEIRRTYWDLGGGSEIISKQLAPPVLTPDTLSADEAIALVPIMKRWQVLTPLFENLLKEWEADLIDRLKNNPQSVAKGSSYWAEWGAKIRDAIDDAYIASALQGSKSLGLDLSFTEINPLVREIASKQAFSLTSLEGSQSMVRTRRDALDQARRDLADGSLAWTDLEGRLNKWFDPARAKMIARSENTAIWAEAQLQTGLYAEMDEKRSVRADRMRVCPTGVCDDAAARNWVSIDEEFVPGHKIPSYHPSCFCFIQVRKKP